MFAPDTSVFPTPLSAYPAAGESLFATLAARAAYDPFNLVVTGIFFAAILHTFAAARMMALAQARRRRQIARHHARGLPPPPGIAAELLHFLGEVEVVFGLWAIVLLAAITYGRGWPAAVHYVNDGVTYTEPLFVVVIMALASTRPVVTLAESLLRRVAALGGGTPAAWWMAILTLGPLLGSAITEPAAMTISALLLARQIFDLRTRRCFSAASSSSSASRAPPPSISPGSSCGRRCWSASFWPAWSFTAACRRGGSRRYCRAWRRRPSSSARRY